MVTFPFFLLCSLHLGVLGISFMLLGLVFDLYDYSLFLDLEFFSLNSLVFGVAVYFDYWSLCFLGTVTLISSMVVMYSYVYMEDDYYMNRFLWLVLLFICSMLIFVVSGSLVGLLLGWDGSGLVSYCLVVYFQNWKSYLAGLITLLMNRVGDVAILVMIGVTINLGDYYYVYFNWLAAGEFEGVLLGLVLLAGFTSSAQIPFSIWLPAAMAAPTPVSALVHSSTLVTAGVYLLIRFGLGGSVYVGVVLISLLTALVSSINAFVEFDLSSVVALSTLSHLGLMMSILFMGYIDLAFFHLINHAFFKSLLFLCSGLVVHWMHGIQDIRYMSNSLSYMPLFLLYYYKMDKMIQN